MQQGTADGVSAVAELLTAGSVLVLTGAGISTDSGIPDYRGVDGRRHRTPMSFDEFVGSEAQRRRYWARSQIGWQRVTSARPNVAHHAVTALQRGGRLSAVVTQNVDGLHTAAGTSAVVDLHGRLDRVVCLGCGDRRPRVEIALRLAAVNPGFREAMLAPDAALRPDGDVVLPDDAVRGFRVVACRRCGGVLKPDVVFFGETVPRERFGRAMASLEVSSALLVLGSSLAVGSGYRFVTAASRQGLPVAIVNRGPTRGDRHATVKLDTGLGEVMPLLAAAGPRHPASPATGLRATGTPR